MGEEQYVSDQARHLHNQLKDGNQQMVGDVDEPERGAIKVVHQTSDGQTFETKEEAINKQREIDYTKRIRKIHGNLGMYSNAILINAKEFHTLLSDYIKECEPWQ